MRSRRILPKNCSIHGEYLEISGPYNFWARVENNISDVWKWNCWTLFVSEIGVGRSWPPCPHCPPPVATPQGKGWDTSYFPNCRGNLGKEEDNVAYMCGGVSFHRHIVYSLKLCVTSISEFRHSHYILLDSNCCFLLSFINSKSTLPMLFKFKFMRNIHFMRKYYQSKLSKSLRVLMIFHEQITQWSSCKNSNSSIPI